MVLDAIRDEICGMYSNRIPVSAGTIIVSAFSVYNDVQCVLVA